MLFSVIRFQNLVIYVNFVSLFLFYVLFVVFSSLPILKKDRCPKRRLNVSMNFFQIFHRIILLRVVVAAIKEDQPNYFHMRLRAICLDTIKIQRIQKTFG